MKFTILGELYSSKNSRRITYSRSAGRYFLLKSAQATTDEKELVNKLINIRQAWHEEIKYCAKPLKIEFEIYRKTRRKFDYINIIQNLCDCMVKAGLLPDDNADEVLPVFVPYKVDAERPRVNLTVLNKPENLLFSFDFGDTDMAANKKDLFGVKCSNNGAGAILRTSDRPAIRSK